MLILLLLQLKQQSQDVIDVIITQARFHITKQQQYKIQNTNMTTSSTTAGQLQSLAIWKVKLELAQQGSYQAIQQVKQHVLQQTDESHPIFKQSFYDILQQGYQLHELPKDTVFRNSFETYKDFPLIFLIHGCVSVKCINLDGDTQAVLKIKSKGLVTVEQPTLQKKYGQTNINLLTKFQIYADQQSILLQILGSNKLQEIIKRKQVTEKETNIMRRFMLFPSKQVVRVTVNHTNQDHIKDRVYLLSGKACYYLDDQKQFGKRLILCCYQQGYLNPKQFNSEVEETSSSIPSSFNITHQKKRQKSPSIQVPSISVSNATSINQAIKKQRQVPQVKLYIFQNSEIMYLQQNFLKDDLIKAIQLKRQEHINQIIQKYRQMNKNIEKDKDKQCIETAQNNLIMKYKINKKQANSNVYKIVENVKNKGFLTAKQPMNEKRIKTKTDLTSTSSSMKCSIRIRKSKKVM